MKCEIAIRSDGGLGSRGVPAGRPVAQRSGSRHISDQDTNDNNNNDEQRRQNNNDNHDESGVEELVSEVEGSEDKVYVCCGVEASTSICAVRGFRLSVDVNDNDNENDNDNDNGKHESTTNHAQRHGLADFDVRPAKTSPFGVPHEVLKV